MTKPNHHDIVVIGAGICGATIARELLDRGKSVCVIDAADSAATACSSHAYAIAHPHIGKGSPRLLRLTRLAFLLAEARWGETWNAHGIFLPTKKDRAFNRDEISTHLQSLNLEKDIAIALDVNEANGICGIEQSGVWIARGASLDLFQTTKQLLSKHERLSCMWDAKIARLENAAGVWRLLDDQARLVVTTNKVVIAAAMSSKPLINSLGLRLPLRPVRGQLSIFSIQPDDPWVAKLPKVGISGEGYCLPALRLNDGRYRWMVGSSFDEGEDDLAPRQASDSFNREQAKGLVNYVDGDIKHLHHDGEFVGVRCVAGDRLPIIGKLDQRPGIFIATALGSRGILWSALAAKLITAQLLEDDFALLARLGFASDLVAALAPARFLAGALAAPGALASNSKPILPSDPNAK
jgi:tRNA 5-methylaminomethyl-2-thiouridine biosynthesis bifunctional protein